MKRVTLIGDSIRMGYQPTVAEKLKDDAEVWGPEANGGDSANVLANVDDWVLNREAEIIHINCGLHDCKRDANGENIQVPIDQYEQNVRSILSKVKAGTDAQILWTLTTPVNEKNHLARKNFVRLNKDIQACNAVARRLAAELDIPVNDLHAFVIDMGPENILMPDGVHYTEGGCRVLGKIVSDFIGSHL